MTPFRAALVHGFGRNTNDDDYSPSDTMEMIRLLLRHGAPLDDYASYAGGGGTRLTAGPPNGGRFSADTCLSTGETNFPQLAQNEAFVEAKAVVAGVRACGPRWTSTVACRTSKFSASGRSSRAAARFLFGSNAGDRAAATGDRTAPPCVQARRQWVCRQDPYPTLIVRLRTTDA